MRPSVLSTLAHRRRAVWVGLLVAMVLMIGLAAGLLIVQQSQLPMRVRNAVQVTFPTFCSNFENQIVVELNTTRSPVPSERYWDVRCEPGSWATGPAMVIDIETCSVLKPILGIPEWYQVYDDLYADGQQLVACP